ncbi:hypothetical protein SpCBS45565_g01050 [Spizellomyces sp. 'palustris']|nr:hypothetical protein SpCBS45565_g01050 [Spizellomyces sp. 'palustris']
MGQSLSTRFEWIDQSVVTSKQTAEDNDGGQLKTSIVNHALLSDLIRMIEQLCRAHPSEARSEFRRPLQWSSNLRPAAFSAAGDKWIVQSSGPKGGKVIITSTETRADGQPLFQFEQSGGQTTESTVYIARVASFDYLNRVLQLAEEHKLRELQEIIQANRDPAKTIFGVSGDNALVDAFEAFSNEQDPRKRDQYSKLYKLLLILNTFDLQLMKSAVQDLQKEKTLNVQKIREELQMIQAFCGRDPARPAISIDWESDYTFANGYKAPPWRQVYGEICYLEVQPFDREKMIITASKRGYFVSKGYSADDKGKPNFVLYEID